MVSLEPEPRKQDQRMYGHRLTSSMHDVDLSLQVSITLPESCRWSAPPIPSPRFVQVTEGKREMSY